MSDLHARILDQIADKGDDYDCPAGHECAGFGPDGDGRAAAALRAVVQRHKPVPCNYQRCLDPERHTTCEACGQVANHPCDELRVIAEQVGIPTEDVNG